MNQTRLTFQHSFPKGKLIGEFCHTFWIPVRTQSNKDGTETWTIDSSEDAKRVLNWLTGKKGVSNIKV